MNFVVHDNLQTLKFDKFSHSQKILIFSWSSYLTLKHRSLSAYCCPFGLPCLPLTVSEQGSGKTVFKREILNEVCGFIALHPFDLLISSTQHHKDFRFILACLMLRNTEVSLSSPA